MTKTREQYNRMKRWYKRFAAIDRGRVHDTPSENYVDEIHAFFLNCHHLKDWIKHDDSVLPTIQQIVEDHITASSPLQLCADICNSLKHLKLTRPPRSNENPAFGSKKLSLEFGPGIPATISLKYEVQTKTGSKDAFQLATECISSWDGFLSRHSL